VAHATKDVCKHTYVSIRARARMRAQAHVLKDTLTFTDIYYEDAQ